jgi:hypothetical protein
VNRGKLNYLIIIFLCLIQSNSFGWQPPFTLTVEIPDSVIQKTDEYIKLRVGEKYFDKFIKFDDKNSGFRKSYIIDSPPTCAEMLKQPHYYLSYKIYFSDMEKDFAEIDMITDIEGNLIMDCFIDKVPKCPENNCWDYFPVVKKEEAIRIAKNAGLEDGIKDWTISLSYNYYDVQEYTWVVKNTLQINDKNSGGGANGKLIIINAIDGSVIGEEGWASIK